MNRKKGRSTCFTKNLLGSRPIIVASLIVLSALILGSFLPACPTAFASNPAVWSLVWSDEFDGPSGSAVDPTKWSFDIGGNGWGNNELETYTNRTVNAHVEGGLLVIKAIKETLTGPDNFTRDYTSARLLTKNKFTQAYGRFEARLKVPYGQGLWPRFGCWATTSVPPAGQLAARSTSWKTSARNRRSFMALFMGQVTRVEAG